jgi:glycerophosphoryl diester phosphodiesterase
VTGHPYFEGPLPRVLAHRGLADPAGAYVENSVAAVVAALSAGAVYVESDCHLTADGHVVLFHDDSVERITGDPRLVADLTLEELTDLMVDRGGLLTLPVALDAFPGVHWNLDVKAAAAAEPVGRLVAPHGDRVLLASFSDARRLVALDAARREGGMRPATSAGSSTILRTVLATATGSRRLVARVLRGIDALQIPERQGPLRILTKRLIRYAHAAGVEVHVWTVNDPIRMRLLVDMGVDAIVTDRVDLALETLSG